MTEKTPKELSDQTDYMFKYSQLTAEEKKIAQDRCKDLFLYYAIEKLHSEVSEIRRLLIDSEASSMEFCQYIHPDILLEVYEELCNNGDFDKDVLDTLEANDLIKNAIKHAHDTTKSKITKKAEIRASEIEYIKRRGRNNTRYFKD